METDRLKHFRVLVETINMRKAAELLHISHGGLSKSIKKLENELGTRLIRPEGRGIAITDGGKKLYGKALDLLKTTEQFLAEAKGQGQISTNRQLRVGSFEVFTTYFIGAFLEVEPKLGPLQLREYTPGRLEAAIEAKEIDIGITYVPIPHHAITFNKTVSIEMGIFVARGAFLKISVEMLPFVVPIAPVEGSPTGIKGLDGWPDHLFPRHILFEVELMESALELSRRGMCAVFLPCFVARLHNMIVDSRFALTQIPYPASVHHVFRDVYLMTRKDSDHEKLLRKIAKGLRTICATR